MFELFFITLQDDLHFKFQTKKLSNIKHIYYEQKIIVIIAFKYVFNSPISKNDYSR